MLRSCVCIGMLLAATPLAAEDWRQWGGSERSFKSNWTGLAANWSGNAPKTVWKCELGEGYSAILAAGDTLYTMYRTDDDEHVVALSARTGETRWTHTYAAPMPDDADTNFGRGPNATPVLADDRLVTVGFNGRLHCLDAKSGKVIWSHDLMGDLRATPLAFGYSSSPLPYKETVILPLGAEGKSVAAFVLADGKIKWSTANYENSYSTPILAQVGAKQHVTFVTPKEIIGVDPDNGDLLWSHAFINQWDTHCTTPVDCGQGRVFYPSFQGGVMLQITEAKHGADVKELWKTKRVGAGQTNVVCVGDVLYGAGGSGRSSFFAAVRAADGSEAWGERVPLSNVLAVDGRLLVLDENGTLRMLKVSAEKFEPLGEVEVLQNKAWTVPTLVDGRLYLRDQKNILALDLASGAQ